MIVFFFKEPKIYLNSDYLLFSDTLKNSYIKKSIALEKKDIALLDATNKTKNQFLFIGGAGIISIFGFIFLFSWAQELLQF